SDDIAGIRAIYSSSSSRAPDIYDTPTNNDSFLTATPLTAQLDPTALTALVGNLDITTTSDSDYFSVVAPNLTSGTFTVTVQGSGLSLLPPRLTVYAADQTTVLATVSGAGTYGATLTATIPNVSVGDLFYVKVSGASQNAFGTGAYALTLNFGTGSNPTVTLPNTLVANGNPIQGGGGQALRLTPETRVNSSTLNTQVTSADNPQAVGMDARGNTAGTWASYAGDGSGWGVYARRLDSSGHFLGDEFLVNSTTTGDQVSPAVVVAADGSFVIAWASNNLDGNGWDVYARRVDANGKQVGEEFRVNTTSPHDQTKPVRGIDGNGNFVIVWTSGDSTTGNWDVYGQRFSASGDALGGEFLVNSTTAGDQFYARVNMNDSGAFVVTWSSNLQDGNGWDVYARRFHA